MCVHIGIEQLPDHALVLRPVLRGLALEEVDALLAECERHLDALLTKLEFVSDKNPHLDLLKPIGHSTVGPQKNVI